MFVKETEGIEISVRTRYEAEYSNPLQSHFLFSYHIQIHNKNDFAVRLLRRHWIIQDEQGRVREVEGAGIVGEQPLILPGACHSYSSFCDLTTLRGKMHGTYSMIRDDDRSRFQVQIPEFILNLPFTLN